MSSVPLGYGFVHAKGIVNVVLVPYMYFIYRYQSKNEPFTGLEHRSTIASIALIVLGFTVLTLLMGPQHFNGLYYAMTTVSTVGYGDISPKTPFAKLVGITIMSTVLVAVVL